MYTLRLKIACISKYTTCTHLGHGQNQYALVNKQYVHIKVTYVYISKYTKCTYQGHA